MYMLGQENRLIPYPLLTPSTSRTTVVVVDPDTVLVEEPDVVVVEDPLRISVNTFHRRMLRTVSLPEAV